MSQSRAIASQRPKCPNNGAFSRYSLSDPLLHQRPGLFHGPFFARFWTFLGAKKRPPLYSLETKWNINITFSDLVSWFLAILLEKFQGRLRSKEGAICFPRNVRVSERLFYKRTDLQPWSGPLFPFHLNLAPNHISIITGN